MKRLWGNTTWQVCCEQWIDSFQSPTTRQGYEYVITAFFRACPKTPDRVTRADVERFLNQPVMRPGMEPSAPSPYTHNNRLGVLCSFYSWCKKYMVEFRGKIVPILRGEKPTTGVKLLQEPDPERDMTEEHLTRFFSTIGKSAPELRDRALFLAIFLSGRRKTEVSTLLRRDLERASFVENGERRAGWMFRFKNKGRLTKDDWFEFPPLAMAALREFLTATGRDLETMRPEEPLFPATRSSSCPDQPMNASHIDRRFRKYAKLAGLPDSLVVHSFRHAAAVERYFAHGNDLLQVSDDLRHSNPKTTLIYINRRRRRTQGDTAQRVLAQKFSHL